MQKGISIHALREEGDDNPPGQRGRCKQFLSTPSARRATGPKPFHRGWQQYFYPRPPRGGRRAARWSASCEKKDFYPRPPRGGRHSRQLIFHSFNVFLSTPSARRATDVQSYDRSTELISIHALRAEGDCRATFREGQKKRFLSTPSARRATAKTETKSPFSYKLYNILHEFRRALIYNGSKNYPNHAK